MTDKKVMKKVCVFTWTRETQRFTDRIEYDELVPEDFREEWVIDRHMGKDQGDIEQGDPLVITVKVLAPCPYAYFPASLHLMAFGLNRHFPEKYGYKYCTITTDEHYPARCDN